MGYNTTHQSALAQVREKGKAVSFALQTGGAAVAGFAVQTRGDPRRYEALNLVQTQAPTLFFVPTTFGQEPVLNALCMWGDKRYVVRSVDPVAPDGTAIAARVIISK